MKLKRIQWLDFARGLTMLLVVIAHSGAYNTQFYWIYENLLLIFVMPTFFAISGFLYKPTTSWKEYKMLLYKKIGSFLIPYTIFTFTDIVIHMTANHDLFTNLYRIYDIPVGYLWFLYALFFIFILIGLMDLLHINFIVQLIISLMLLFIQMCLPWQESSRGNFNPLAGIGGYMICFYLGFIIKKYDVSRLLKSKIFSLLLTVTWIILVIIEFIIVGLKYNTNVFTYKDVIVKLLSIPILFSLFINVKHSRIFDYFDKYGKQTLIIYLVHMPIIALADNFLNRLSVSNSFITFIILFGLGWYFSIFLCYLSKRFKIINFIFYPRKYFDEFFMR